MINSCQSNPPFKNEEELSREEELNHKGGLTREKVLKTVRHHLPGIKKCYNSLHLNDHGTMTIFGIIDGMTG